MRHVLSVGILFPPNVSIFVWKLNAFLYHVIHFVNNQKGLNINK
jgi:hypothetical protein